MVIWNATHDMGQGVPAGVYIYSLKADGKSINRKMLLIDGQQGSIQAAAHSCSEGISVLNKRMSDQYVLEVIGENIAPYKQQDLEIIGSMTVDVMVTRTVTDIDGNVYRTVKIGNQWWMAKNLKVTHYRNGDAILNETDNSTWAGLSTGAYCAYNNNESTTNAYGYLYNWYAVDDSRNIAPASWHVPTDEEWKTLEKYLGMSQSEADEYGWHGTDEGGKLKETDTTHWQGPNTGATNESGFFALLGGSRNLIGNGYFGLESQRALFWSASQNGNYRAWSRYMIYNNPVINRSDYPRQSRLSVRLVRD